MSFLDQINYELLVASLALVLTLWEARANREHNRLSIRPLLAFATDRTKTERGHMFKFCIANKGLGPAVIHERYFTRGGTKFTDADQPGYIRSIIAAHLEGKCKYTLTMSHLPGRGTAILAGEEFCLFEATIEAIPSSPSAPGYEVFDGLDFDILYSSLYGERFKFTTTA